MAKTTTDRLMHWLKDYRWTAGWVALCVCALFLIALFQEVLHG